MIQKNTHGFTMIELVIGIAIMGLLAAIAGYGVMNIYENMKVKTTKQSLKGVQNAIKLFNVDTNTYPTKLKDLVKRPENEDIATNWGPKPYMDSEPVDSWGNKINYKPTPDGEHPYELYSYGSGGKKSPKSEWLNVWKIK